MGRFYADENFPLAAVQQLQRLGHDVVTAQEAGQANRSVPDADVCTDNPDRQELAERIQQMVQGHEDLRGILLRVYRPG